MKKKVWVLIWMLICTSFLTVCVFAESAAPSIKEQANAVWSEICTFVEKNYATLAATGGGIFAMVGVAVTTFKLNPKVFGWIESFGSSIKKWIEDLSENAKNAVDNVEDLEKKLDEFTNEVLGIVREIKKNTEKQRDATMAMIEAFEDVVKLSGASEEKKDIYIAKIEDARRRLGNDEEKKD